MTPVNSEKYAESLMQRVGEARPVKKIAVKFDDWEPKPNMCHHNAMLFCDRKPDWSPVRGWLYFDLTGLDIAKFVSHSVVQAPDGTYCDITPWGTTTDYPFLAGNLGEEEYADLVETQGFDQLHPRKNWHSSESC